MPGCGQEPGEPLIDTLRRECEEELGVDVVMHDLRFVREFISRNHARTASLPPEHQIEHVFPCSLVSDEERVTARGRTTARTELPGFRYVIWNMSASLVRMKGRTRTVWDGYGFFTAFRTTNDRAAGATFDHYAAPSTVMPDSGFPSRMIQ